MTGKCRSCASCAMPLEKAENFALGDTSSEYCRYCTDKSGKLLPFEKILKMNARHYVETQGITQEAALKMAIELLKSQPAWKSA